MSELNIASNKAIQTAINLYEGINDLFKSFGIVAGGIATSLADWVFGAVTMGVLLSNYVDFPNPWTKWVVGGVFSMALWGIQIILWQTVLTGKIAKIAANRSTSVTIYVVVFFGIIAMKLGDDFSDIVGVYWLIKDNPMQLILAANVYKFLLVVVYFLTWAICGFAEVFVALSINLLKEGQGGGGGNKDGRPQGSSQPNNKGPFVAPKSGYKASFRPGSSNGQNNNRPTPAAASRPLYSEPTYHPVRPQREDEHPKYDT